ncbi:MAG: CD3072 family TudS-related putative desulfidase [Pseudomonadota bacterium]
MKRSNKIIVVSHCILNANAKVRPIAMYPGVLRGVVDKYIEAGVGILQLPCPESSYLGIDRWGMCYEQYDHPNFRRHCRNILTPSIDQMETFIASGCEILGIIGADGSPNCGVTKIPSGLSGGVIRNTEAVRVQLENFRYVQGTGVFFGVLKQMLADRGISCTFMAVDENNPSSILTQ